MNLYLKTMTNTLVTNNLNEWYHRYKIPNDDSLINKEVEEKMRLKMAKRLEFFWKELNKEIN